MNNNRKRIFIAGNFLSGSIGTRGIGEELAIKLKMANLDVFTASQYKDRLFRMVDFIFSALRYRYDIAIVEVYSDFAFIWAEILCCLLRLMNKQYILVLHGGKLPEFAQRNLLRVQKMLRSAWKVITPSKYIQQSFLQYRQDILYIPNGIELSAYPFGLRKNIRPKMIWLRAFHSIYRPAQAIEVLRLVSMKNSEADLLMVGPDKHDGSYDQVLKKIELYCLTGNVTIVGPISKTKVGNYLNKADIFLNTTIYESFGVSALEAAACGLCIVTTNVGELPLLWEDGVDALLVPPDDPEAMAVAVQRILTEPGLAERLSQNARKKAEQFDWSIILPKWEKLFEEATNGR